MVSKRRRPCSWARHGGPYPTTELRGPGELSRCAPRSCDGQGRALHTRRRCVAEGSPAEARRGRARCYDEYSREVTYYSSEPPDTWTAECTGTRHVRPLSCLFGSSLSKGGHEGGSRGMPHVLQNEELRR